MSWLLGSYHPEIEDKSFPIMQFNDAKINKIGCISDAEELRSYSEFNNTSITQEENFNHLYNLAIQANNSDHLGTIEEYIRKHSFNN